MIGVALAWVAVRVLVTSAPTTLPRLEEIRLTGVSLAFAARAQHRSPPPAFAAAPLLQRVPLLATLHESGRGTSAGRQRHRARQVLMAAQTALALVLLVASGLLIRSFQHLRAIDPGFEAGSALAFRVGLPARTYADRDAAVAAHRAIIDRLKELPEACRRVRRHLPAARGRVFRQLHLQGRRQRSDPAAADEPAASCRDVPRRRAAITSR